MKRDASISVPVRASKARTVPVVPLVTQTLPSAAARLVAPVPVFGCRPFGMPVSVSSRVTRSSWMLSTHTAPPATTAARGRLPTGNGSDTRSAGLAAGVAVGLVAVRLRRLALVDVAQQHERQHARRRDQGERGRVPAMARAVAAGWRTAAAAS